MARVGRDQFILVMMVIVISALITFALATTTTIAAAEADELLVPHSSPANVDRPLVGIDLGSRYARVAFVPNDNTNQVEIIPNDQGTLATPTYVTWDPLTGDPIVGERAKQQAILNPYHTVYDVKRLLGRTYDSDEVQTAIAQLPYAIVERDGKPVIQVQVGPTNTWQEFSPEDITAIVLAHLKHSAEQYLGHEVLDAVVTVPAYFDDAQRQAVKEAGDLAGLTILRIINEPTAAAIAHKIDKTATGEQNVVVVDVGGGTTDVTLLVVDAGIFEVLATNRKILYGGGDAFDNTIVQHCITKWKTDHGVDISSDLVALQNLHREAEQAKRALSVENEAQVRIERPLLSMSGAQVESQVLTETISRSLFATLTRDLVEPIRTVLDEVLVDGKLTKAEVDHIVLVGGSTQMRVVRHMVSAYFNEKIPSTIADDEVGVAHGAAVQASVLIGRPDDYQGITWLTFTTLSLGVETAGGIMHKVIPRHSICPTTRSELFTTLHANQTNAKIRVYEGQRILTKDNRLITQLQLSGLNPRPDETSQIKITFNIDVNCEQLVVAARHVASGSSANASVVLDQNHLAWQAIEAQVNAAEQAETVDSSIKERISRWLESDGMGAIRTDDSELENIRREFDDSDDAIVVAPREMVHAHDEL